MKTIAIILAAFGLVSCGVPVEFRVGYRDPSNGIDVDAGYSSKRGITTGVDYRASK